jgi:hypothetical protein
MKTLVEWPLFKLMVAECVRTGKPVGAAMAFNVMIEGGQQSYVAKGSLRAIKMAASCS